MSDLNRTLSNRPSDVDAALPHLMLLLRPSHLPDGDPRPLTTTPKYRPSGSETRLSTAHSALPFSPLRKTPKHLVAFTFPTALEQVRFHNGWKLLATDRLDKFRRAQHHILMVSPAPSCVRDRFQIVRQLGGGGMGLVYEAFDRHTGRHVALKTMRAPTGDALLRFKQEFRSLQGIHHPNLVSLGDLMEEAGQWWFSMELVHGVNFLEYVRSIPTAATPGSKLGDDDTAEQDALAQTLSPEELSDTGHAGEGAGPSVSPIDQGMTEGRVRLPLDEVKLRAALKQLVEGLHTLHIAQKVHRDAYEKTMTCFRVSAKDAHRRRTSHGYSEAEDSSYLPLQLV
jgi:hypothetical protein